MGKIRDTINNMDFQEEIYEDDVNDKLDDYFEEIKVPTCICEEVEYSYDCENCEFRRYMELLGVCIDESSCWIDCTKEIKEELDGLFRFILDKTYTNNQNAVLYIGNLVNGKEIVS